MGEVVVTDEFAGWYEELDESAHDAVYRVVELLVARGVTLRWPHSSEVKGSRYALRELRTQSKCRPLPVFYAFDPARRAVCLLGEGYTGDERAFEQRITHCGRVRGE